MPIEARGKSRYVDANGLRVHALEYGGGDRCIVIVPGITSPAITWEFVAEELAGDDTRVLAVDVRGRGLSDKPEAGFTMQDYASDLAGLIDALDLERPILLGHSMGARIVAALAAQDAPDTGPLLLVEPPLTGPGRSPYPTPVESFEQQLQEAYAGTTVEEVRRFYPRWSERELELRVDWLSTCDEKAVVETHHNFHREDFYEYWPRLRPPLLFLYGEDSPVVTEDDLAELASANPAGQLAGIPEAGHMTPWENLTDFLAAVRGFLGESSYRSRSAR